MIFIKQGQLSPLAIRVRKQFWLSGIFEMSFANVKCTKDNFIHIKTFKTPFCRPNLGPKTWNIMKELQIHRINQCQNRLVFVPLSEIDPLCMLEVSDWNTIPMKELTIKADFATIESFHTTDISFIVEHKVINCVWYPIRIEWNRSVSTTNIRLSASNSEWNDTDQPDDWMVFLSRFNWIVKN